MYATKTQLSGYPAEKLIYGVTGEDDVYVMGGMDLKELRIDPVPLTFHRRSLDESIQQ